MLQTAKFAVASEGELLLPSPMASLSSLCLSNPRFLRRSLNPNPNPALRLAPHRSHQNLEFATKSSSQDSGNLTAEPLLPQFPPPSSEKKSFAVTTGEIFLGIASRLIKRRRKAEDGEVSDGVSILGEELEREEPFSWRSRGDKGRIAAVVEDREVVWEQRMKDVEAERRRTAVTSPGFSFSAAGLLFPYHLGVAHCLIEKGYIKETTPLAGSSAGAIVCAVIASGASMEEALKAMKVLAEDCRLRGTAFRLGAVLRDVLENFLPDDVHIKSNGRVRVAVTQILWRPRGLLVDQFDSKEDLISAVFTSSFIPGYLAPRPATMFRNRLCIDGGVTLFMPPTSAPQTVRVCAFPASCLGLQRIGISPDCNPENRASPRKLLNWALEPADDSVLDKLFELGYLDAAVWAEENPVEYLVNYDGPVNQSVVLQ